MLLFATHSKGLNRKTKPLFRADPQVCPYNPGPKKGLLFFRKFLRASQQIQLLYIPRTEAGDKQYRPPPAPHLWSKDSSAFHPSFGKLLSLPFSDFAVSFKNNDLPTQQGTMH